MCVRPGRFLANPTLSHLAGLLDRSLGTQAPAEEGGDLQDALLAAVERAAARLSSPPRGATVASRPRVVLVTGATGFVGSSLLVEIARQSSARIVALVRGRDRADATARLRAACERIGVIWSEVLAARITVEVGDLAEPRLGLTGDVYAAGRRGRRIYHCGARVDSWAYRDLRRPTWRHRRESSSGPNRRLKVFVTSPMESSRPCNAGAARSRDDSPSRRVATARYPLQVGGRALDRARTGARHPGVGVPAGHRDGRGRLTHLQPT